MKPESPGRNKKLVKKRNGHKFSIQFSHIMKINDCLPS